MVAPKEVIPVAQMVEKLSSRDGSVSPRSLSKIPFDIFDSKTVNFLKTEEERALRSDQTSKSSSLETKLLLLSSIF